MNASPLTAMVRAFAANREARDRMAIDEDIQEIVAAFHKEMQPLESLIELKILTDRCTGARYCECHVRAEKLLVSANIDAALNPDTQPEYRLNREIVGNQAAFLQMQDDALKGRSFSNIMAEYRPAAGRRPNLWKFWAVNIATRPSNLRSKNR
jgi:hypothetical protein